MAKSMQLTYVDLGAENHPELLSEQGNGLQEFGSKLANLLNDFNDLVSSGAMSSVPVTLNNVLEKKWLGEQADWLYKTRRKRERYFGGDLFGEAAWDILLDLFSAECSGKTVSITSACIGSGVPSTTALRWISALYDAGLVERCNDPHDGRRAFVRLSVQGRSAMASFLEDTAKN